MKRHLTDGEIHAWLDGELDDAAPEEAATSLRDHLEGCDACRARLDGEAALRERAAAILAGAAPSAGVLPSFEELRARARATDPRRPSHRAGSRLAHLRRWGWAASVVVALGIGWGVRDRVPVPGEEEIGAAGEAAQLRDGAPGAARGGTARLQGAAAGDGTMPASETPASGDALASGSGDVAVTRPGDAGASGAADAAARASEVLASRSGDAAATRPGDAAASGAADAAPGAGGAVDSGAGDAGTPTSDDAVVAAPAEVVAKAAVDAADPTGPAGDRRPAATYAAGADVRAEPPVADSPGESPRSAQEAVALDELVVTGAPVTDSGSPPVSSLLDPRPRMAPMPTMATRGRDPDPRSAAVEARRARAPSGTADEAVDAGALVLTVESLDVLSVVWSEVAPGVRGVKVLQRLDRSDTLELVVIPGRMDDEAAEAALAAVLEEPLRPGWSRLVRVREGARIVARAPLPAAALSRLVEGVGRR
ncbi:MAG: hypothetical protein KY453_02255 [Gemmatimonadetes bacterium]|nr:hypothetical protein [Gemmatimonadota bacterium]